MNLAGVEIILNMRRKMEQMQAEINEFLGHVARSCEQASQEGWRSDDRPGEAAPSCKAPGRPSRGTAPARETSGVPGGGAL